MTPSLHYGCFIWNIDQSVGKGGTNSNFADVYYVQWYYKLAGQSGETPPERRAIYKAVELNGACTGAADDPLALAISAHQAAINHPIVDGKVSVAQAGGKIGGSAFFVYRLGARLARMYPTLWPRLDLMPLCPGPVIEASLKAVPKY